MARSKGTPGGVTLVDVAKAAGVATMTVSRYLNQHPNVTEKTARKVRIAIEKLGYSPNHAARMLMGQPSKVIGLIVPDLTLAFFATVAQHVQEVARQKGYLVWIAATNSVSADTTAVLQMKQHHVDGILLVPSPGKGVSEAEIGGLPMIALCRPLVGTRIDSVTLENRRNGRDATEHLVSHGYKKIACLGLGQNIYTMGERLAGYSDVMREHRLPVLPYTECIDADSTLKTIRRLLSAKIPVQALITFTSVTTIRVIQALDELGVSIPNDVGLIGFDDIELAGVLRPRLTVIKEPPDELGQRAARLLLDLIASKEEPAGVTVTIPASLIIRESCGCKMVSKKNSGASLKG
jgi:LacI family transcriptional regulator